MIVVDASFAVEASLTATALSRLKEKDAVAPPLMWSEATSVLHAMQWRGVISPALAAAARQRIEQAPVAVRRPATLLERAWLIAEGLGWAKTYDAEYVALAQILHCPLLTLDEKLSRAASRLVAIAEVSDL